jgi:tetratricopeptide (TPR) repeat protein
MNWKQELRNLEREKRWGKALHFVKRLIKKNQQDPEVYISAMYFLLNLLLEEDYESYGITHDELASLLSEYFNDSLSKFNNNAEYLFFVGYFSKLAEWYFGQKDHTLSHKMLNEATKIEPQNSLYNWGYKFSTADDEAIGLARSILSKKNIVDALISKGSFGEYILSAISYSSRINTFQT